MTVPSKTNPLPAKRRAAALALLLLGAVSCASNTSNVSPNHDETIGLDPAAARLLAGVWVFEMKTGDHTVDGKLRIAFDGTGLTGVYIGPDETERPLSEIQIAKGKVAWKMPGQRGTQQVSGTFEDGSMQGAIKRVRNEDDADSSSSDAAASGGYHGGGGGGRGGHSHRGGGRSTPPTTHWTATKAPADAAPAGK